MGYKDVSTSWGGGEEVSLELRDGGGRQWTVETGGKRFTQTCPDFLLLALFPTPTNQHPRIARGGEIIEIVHSFMQPALIKYVIKAKRIIFKGIKLAY